MDNRFTEEDQKKIVEFLNLVATHAEFTMSTKHLIDYFKLLSFMQNQLLPKVEAHIFEVKKVTEPEKKDGRSRGTQRSGK